MKTPDGSVASLILANTEGRGRAASHFGEVLQGAFRLGGEVRHALVTMPLGVRSSRATFKLHARGETTVKVALYGARQGDFTKAVRAAEASLLRWVGGGFGGTLSVSGDVPRGRGMGSSTSEVVAVVRAVADALGVEPSAEEVARLVRRSESASDPLMLDDGLSCRIVLFDQRRCEVLVEMGGTLPAFEVVGVDTGGAGISTEDLELPQYTVSEISHFGDLLISLKEAVRTGDARSVGRVATESARINQSYLPKPGFEDFVRLGQECGSLGVNVAHSGTVMGMIFPSSTKENPERGAEEAARRLGDLGHETLRFGVPFA